MDINLNPDISEEEMDAMRKNSGGKFELLVEEKDVPVEIIGFRQNVLTQPEQTAKWGFPNNEMVIFNVKFAISDDHDGANSRGRRGDITAGFALSGNAIDWSLDENRSTRDSFLRDLIPFFGGWNAKQPGTYPTQANGTLVCPTYLVGNPTEFEERLNGAKAKVNITISKNGKRNYYSTRPLAA